MSKNDAVRVLCGLSKPLDSACAPAMRPFDERALRFLSDLSAALLKDKRSRNYSDVVTLAFFCRRASLESLKAPYAAMTDRIGRGMVFHIAPSNVPINFAYSLIAALLAGNSSVVKASSRDFPQVRLVCDVMNALLNGAHAALKPYVNVIVYERDRQDVTEAYSAVCDARLIWGGDETIRRVREARLAPRSFDVTFADRWSALVLDASAVLALGDKALAQAAQGFYNDTYLFDQNACTTPRLLFWLSSGDVLSQAMQRFHDAVHAYAAQRYPIEPVVAVDKLTALYRAALTLGGAALEPATDNLACWVRLNELRPELIDFRCGGGFFLEYAAETTDALLPLLGKKAQTVAYLGADAQALRQRVLDAGVRGCDRIVPLGKTLDFALVWDGYDLIETLSRRVSVV